MRMATGDRFITIFDGTIYGVDHYIFAEEPVKEPPFLGIFGHVYWFCSQIYSQIVHYFKSLHEGLVSGQDLVEIVPMGD